MLEDTEASSSNAPVADPPVTDTPVTDTPVIDTPVTATPPVTRRRKNKMPLAIELLEQPDTIDSQLSSPIFALLPREVRDLIWRFSLTCYEDLDNLYDIQKRYARPRQAAPLRIAVELLLTCQAVYVETFLTPFQVNPMKVFDGDTKDIPPDDPLTRLPRIPLRCSKLKPWQFANISSVELNVQQFTLEGGSLERVSWMVGNSGRHRGHECRSYMLEGYPPFVEPTKSKDGPDRLKDLDENRPPPLQNPLIGRKITHLSIRMSRTDWWTWNTSPDRCEAEPSERLRLEPMINTTSTTANASAMTRGYEARKAGMEPDFELDSFEQQGLWGTQITEHWPDLKTLEFGLETFSCKQNQLDYVAECAKLWKFPLENGYHLVWSGREESLRWRGSWQSYGYEWGSPWIQQRNGVRNCKKTQDLTMIRWRPTKDAEVGDPADGQEFVVRTLTFERRRNEDRSDSFGQ